MNTKDPNAIFGPALRTISGFNLLLGLPVVFGPVAVSTADLGIGLLVPWIYLLPALIAENRRHRERMSIYVLNVFLGWTMIGWIISLVWSYSSQVEQPASGSVNS